MRPVRVLTVLAALVLVATLGLPASAASSATAGCTQPYHPWFQTTTYPVGDPVPDLGTSLRYPARAPDTDLSAVVLDPGAAPVELTASGVVTEYTGGVGGIEPFTTTGRPW